MPKVTPLTPIGVSGAATVMDEGCAKNEGAFVIRGSGGPKVSAIKKVRKSAHGSLPAPSRLDDCARL